MKQIQVELGERSYPVLIGTECLDQALDSLLPKQAKRAAIVTQPNIGIAPSTSTEQEILDEIVALHRKEDRFWGF